MAKEVNGPLLPVTDSIEELAHFWDTHDFTDFENRLEEVTDPVFVRGAALTIRLEEAEIDAVHDIAKSYGIHSEDLVRRWIRERIDSSR